jgi:hypothetical protein
MGGRALRQPLPPSNHHAIVASNKSQQMIANESKQALICYHIFDGYTLPKVDRPFSGKVLCQSRSGAPRSHVSSIEGAIAGSDLGDRPMA